MKEDNNGLPPGWKEVKHAATGQVRACFYGLGVWKEWRQARLFLSLDSRPTPSWPPARLPKNRQTLYIHETTGTKRWDRPTSADDVSSDIQARQQAHAAHAVQEAAAARIASRQQLGKRPRGQEVDPLDPTGACWFVGMA